MIKIKSDKIITPNGLFDGFVYVENGVIKNVCNENFYADESYDYSGKYVSPGFIDLHTHGAGGFAFMDSTDLDVINGCNFHLKHGTTSIMPTISAGDFYRMKNAVINIAKAKNNKELKLNIIGAHLEGPYLSAEQCGAQCPTFITPPIKEDYQGLIEEYREYVSRWTYAPEKDVNGEFAKYLTERGIIVSAGHSNAIGSDMAVAKANGCNLITHLYSCTSTVSRLKGFRRLGIIETAFLDDDIFVEIIADGRHLPSDLIKMIIKIKGAGKVALITDSLEIAGTNIKSGVMSGTEYVVEDGVCKLKDRSAFAGSVATADKLIKTLVFDCRYDICTSVKMLTETPAKIAKINKGSLVCGKDADVIVFDDEIKVSEAFVKGKKVI